MFKWKLTFQIYPLVMKMFLMSKWLLLNTLCCFPLLWKTLKKNYTIYICSFRAKSFKFFKIKKKYIKIKSEFRNFLKVYNFFPTFCIFFCYFRFCISFLKIKLKLKIKYLDNLNEFDLDLLNYIGLVANKQINKNLTLLLWIQK